MSHAWNACGFHDPRGFKSHILRAIQTAHPVEVFRRVRCFCICIGLAVHHIPCFSEWCPSISPGRARFVRECGALPIARVPKDATHFSRPGLLPPPPTKTASFGTCTTHGDTKFPHRLPVTLTFPFRPAKPRNVVREEGSCAPKSGILKSRQSISPGRADRMREFGARVQHDKTPRPNSQVAGFYTEELLLLRGGRLSRGRGSCRRGGSSCLGRWLPAEEVAERGALVGALLDLVGLSLIHISEPTRQVR